MMQYYYDPVTKEYIGETNAFPDPLESAKAGEPVYLTPPNTTFVPPIDLDAGCNIFNPLTEVWTITPDHRGADSWNTNTGELKVIDYLGEVEAGFQLTKPDIPLSDIVAMAHINEYSNTRGLYAVPQEVLDEMTPEQLKKYLLAKVQVIYTKAMLLGVGEYPLHEMLGWAKQEQEARRWQAGNGVTVNDVPTLREIMRRRMDVSSANVTSSMIDVLAAKVIAKVAPYEIFYGNVTGQRQAIEFAIDNAFDNNLTDISRRTAMLAVDIDSITTVANEVF